MDVFDIVKAKLPKDKLPEDTLLALYVAEVGQAAKTYMNRTDIPRELNFTIAAMVIDSINAEQIKDEPDVGRVVSSIKEGDTTVAYSSASKSASQISTESIVLSYVDQLRRFRKLRR